MKNRLFALLLLGSSFISATAIATPLAYVEGTHYQTTAQRIATSDENVVEVYELFSYSCPHCFKLDPQIDE
jgi:thiol:disulfide interchange protein DsbA